MSRLPSTVLLPLSCLGAGHALVLQMSMRCPPPHPLQVYKQKVKHLLYEHQNNLAEVKAEGTVVMKLAQKEHRTQEGALRKDMRVLKVELKEQELANEVVIKNLRLVGTGCASAAVDMGNLAIFDIW